jgi:hypothetical protein
MFHRSLITAAFALAAFASSVSPGGAATSATHHRTIVHHAYTYEPAPGPYYGPYYGPSYGPYYGPSYPPAYAPVAPVTALPGAAVCLAFSLIGAC